jgi:hypothetical protein
MNGNGKSGTILEALKQILQSQVGGWLLACFAFAFMTWWTLEDRKVIYADMARLREHGMALIMETHDAVSAARGGASDNKTLILEAKRMTEEAKHVTEENNDILKEIRSMMNIPLENRSDLKQLLKKLKAEEPDPNP